jgi:hypothetical protein
MVRQAHHERNSKLTTNGFFIFGFDKFAKVFFVSLRGVPSSGTTRQSQKNHNHEKHEIHERVVLFVKVTEKGKCSKNHDPDSDPDSDFEPCWLLEKSANLPLP